MTPPPADAPDRAVSDNLQHILHAGYEGGVGIRWNDPLLLQVGLERSFGVRPSCCRWREGWRHVEVTDRHTGVDYAKVLKDLSDTHFRKAKKITFVQDNLNIHKPASLYEAFPAAEARRLVERFEMA